VIDDENEIRVLKTLGSPGVRKQGIFNFEKGKIQILVWLFLWY
jgi:hypothetical protein